MPDFFALLAACLQALAEELDIDIADIREVESYPALLDGEWWMHINDDRFAHMRMIGERLEVGFSAWYSDFDYLLESGVSHAE